MRRRSFLALTAATMAGAIPVLRNRAPSPMEVAAGGPPTTLSEQERINARVKRQLAAATERTHSPCYKGCMEARVEREVSIHNEMEDVFAKDKPKVVEKYRRELAKSTAAFQGCIGGCR